MEFFKMGFSAACMFATCLTILASNSRANPVEETQDRRLLDSIPYRLQCPHPRGQFPHFRYCDWFYNCWDGAVFEQQCPRGLVFNPRRQYCDYPANVDCHGKVIYADTPADSKCPALDGVFPDPWDCSYFVQCAGGRGTRMTCPSGLLFNPVFYGCDYPQNVKCLGTSTPTQKQDPHSTDEDHLCVHGYYPHTSCQSFWACDGHRPVIQHCPTGQQFDASCAQCRDNQLVQCHVSGGKIYGRSTDQDAQIGANASDLQIPTSHF